MSKICHQDTELFHHHQETPWSLAPWWVRNSHTCHPVSHLDHALFDSIVQLEILNLLVGLAAMERVMDFQ